MSNKHHNRPADTAVDPLAATQPQPSARATPADAVAVTVTAAPEADAGALAAEVERSILGPILVPYGATDVEGGLRITIQRRDEEIERLLDDNRQMVEELNRFHEARREAIGAPEPARAPDPIAQLLHGTALALQATALVDLHREHCGKPGYKGRYLDAATRVGDALCAEIDRG